jgi:hypothetical protein
MSVTSLEEEHITQRISRKLRFKLYFRDTLLEEVVCTEENSRELFGRLRLNEVKAGDTVHKIYQLVCKSGILPNGRKGCPHFEVVNTIIASSEIWSIDEGVKLNPRVIYKCKKFNYIRELKLMPTLYV